jgi:hypothetical protein
MGYKIIEEEKGVIEEEKVSATFCCPPGYVAER